MPFEVDDPFHHAFQSNPRRLTVDSVKFLVIGAVQRGNDQIDGRNLLHKLFLIQKRCIRQQTDFQLGMRLPDMADDRADAGMQSRFADAGKSHIVDFLMFCQNFFQLLNHLRSRKIFPALAGQIGGRPAFAVDTVHRTGLIRQQINAERKPEPAGRNRSEHTLCFDLTHNKQKTPLNKSTFRFIVIIYAFPDK